MIDYLIGTNFRGEKFSRGQIFAGIYFRELAQIRENKTSRNLQKVAIRENKSPRNAKKSAIRENMPKICLKYPQNIPQNHEKWVIRENKTSRNLQKVQIRENKSSRNARKGNSRK